MEDIKLIGEDMELETKDWEQWKGRFIGVITEKGKEGDGKEEEEKEEKDKPTD